MAQSIAVTDDSPVVIYLSSIWEYHEAGVDRVLKELRCKYPKGQYDFDPEWSWFKVSCQPSDVRIVQAIFREIHDELERSMNDERLPAENTWLKLPTPTSLAKEDPGKLPVIDQLCPNAFDKYEFRKVWTRVKHETPDSISVHKVLDEEARQSIMAVSGAHIVVDTVNARLVYIGGATKEAVSKASKALDNLFNRFIFSMPPPKHLLFAEADGPCHVDARYMAHVNDGILTSTIFDPSQFPDAVLDRMLTTVFAKGVCLRICDFDQFRRVQVSLYGPRAGPVFHDQARKWPLWFKKAEYTPKILGVTAPKKEPTKDSEKEPAKPAQQQPSQGNELVRLGSTEANGQGKGKEVAKVPPPTEQFDLLGLDTLDSGAVSTAALEASPAPAMSIVPVAAAPNSAEPTMDLVKVEEDPAPPVQLPPMPESYQSDKHSYQMKLLWDFMNSAKKGSQPKMITYGEHNDHSVKNTQKPEPEKKDEPVETDSLIDILDEKKPEPKTTKAGPVAPTSGQDNMLIQVDMPTTVTATNTAPPTRPTSPSPSEQNPARPISRLNPRLADRIKPGRSMSNALVRRSTFATSLCTCIARLMGDLAYARGRIKLQVELGRIYIMDANPEGLAFNQPGEPASGWPHNDIIARLDTICVSADSITFTKALTLFANDMENIIGLDQKGAIAGLSTGDDGGMSNKRRSDWSVPMSSDWAFHDKRIIYEFKCQRIYMSVSGVMNAQSPFVIEVDGTEPGAFKYSIRSVEDTRPPIWIHCIRRHWDARVSVSYSKTEQLEEEYGAFARDLLRTMVVPPGPITSPKFNFAYDHREAKTNNNQTFTTLVLSARVRNVGRFASVDKQSYLDVSWNWLMSLAKRPGRESPLVGTAFATPAVDNPARGVFTSWYEASVSSAAAEEAFRENETLKVGEMAAWGAGGGGGASTATQDDMFEKAFGPALKLVQKMDGVGVLTDNGQGHQWMPPTKASQLALAVKKFW